MGNTYTHPNRRRILLCDDQSDTYSSPGTDVSAVDVASEQLGDSEQHELERQEGEDAGRVLRLGESAAEAELREQMLEWERTSDLVPLPGEKRKQKRTLPPHDFSQGEKSSNLDEQDLADIEAAYGGIGGASLGFTEDLSAEPATRWLRENDIRLTLAGVERELDSAAADAGLTLNRCREAMPSKGGRPSAARQALRAKVRAILAPIYADGRSRTLMADALRCSRPTLDRLMRPTR